MTADGSIAIAACTVVSRSHLARAAALADSLAAHHPGLRLQALVIDGDRSAVPPVPGPLVVRRPRDLALNRAEYHQMAAIYTPFELACALKPHMMRTLHAEGADAVLYLDGDVLVLGPIDDIFTAAAQHGVALTAHLRTPTDATSTALDLEATVLNAGWINGGLVATGQGGVDFLDWWAARLARGNHLIRPGGIVDQAPLALAPGLFHHVLLSDLGINTAWWTLVTEPVARDHEVLTVAGKPVRVLHLSGYDPAAPHRFSAYDGAAPAASLAENTVLRAHCDGYAASVAAAGDAELRRLPYGFGHLRSGARYDSRMRALVDEALAAHERDGQPAPPDPFADDGGAAFMSWLREPLGPMTPKAPVSRYLRHVWTQTHALQAAYPDLDALAHDFLQHCARAARALEIPLDLLPDGIDTPPRIGPGTLVVHAFPVPSVGTTSPEAAVIEALTLAGARVAAVRTDARGYADRHPAPIADAAILAVDGSMLTAADVALGLRLRGPLPRVGLLLQHGTEMSRVVTETAGLDEIWAPSQWSADVLAANGRTDAWIMSLPVTAPRPGGLRARLGLSNTFLVHTVAGGDGPEANDRPTVAVEAYRDAFEPDAGATLVVRLVSAPGDRERERLMHLAGWRPDVVVMNDLTGAADALLAESDCVVATDPATSTGYTVARALAAGALVIAPGTSGDATHLNPSSGILLGPGTAVDHAESIAGHLRAIHARPDDWAGHRSTAATILDGFSPAQVGPMLVTRLASLRARA